MLSDLSFGLNLPYMALNGGLFISRGRGGRHPDRVIDSYELIYVHQGVLGMYESEESFMLQAGQTLLVRPDRKHGGTMAYPADLRFYWIHFRANPSAAASDVVIDVPQSATLAEPDRIVALFRRFLDDQEERHPGGTVADLVLAQMLCEVARAGHAAGIANNAATVLAQRAEQYIRTHALDGISTSQVAAALDYHADYLGRVFKSVYGVPLTDAINRRRLSEAKQMLLDTGRTVEQIAVACGFADAEYFRRLFRQREGVPPGAFRRAYARMHINSE